MRKNFLSLSLLVTLVLGCVVFAAAQDPQTQQPSSQPSTQPDQSQPSSSPSTAPSTAPDQQQPASPSTSPSTQSPASGAQASSTPTSAGSQVFTGQIVKMADKYVLQDASTGATHQLDDQDRAKTFEGKTVRVNGSLDASNVIHVESIEGAK